MPTQPTAIATLPETADATLGTEWCAPGKGATAGMLSTMARAALHYLNHNDDGRAWIHADSFGAFRRTNLRLTGRPLTAADLERIARCETAR